jgi:AGZA family xanthine/uracil permease-like MFS transporter
MGLNAYFAYQIVGFHGTGVITYNLALTAVFIEGFVFIALSLIGMRQWLVKVIPVSLKVASACGIGLFLAEIGLSYSAGIGAITGGKATPLEIAGCPPQFRDEDGFCASHKMTSPTVCLLPQCRLNTLHDTRPPLIGSCNSCGLGYFAGECLQLT